MAGHMRRQFLAPGAHLGVAAAQPVRRRLRIARQLLLEIGRLGLPAGSEFLDVAADQVLGALQRGPRNRSFAMAVIGVSHTETLSPGEEATVLRALTSRISRVLRGEDWLARSSDGDFVVLVQGSVADAEAVADRLLATVLEDVEPLVAVAAEYRIGEPVDRRPRVAAV